MVVEGSNCLDSLFRGSVGCTLDHVNGMALLDSYNRPRVYGEWVVLSMNIFSLVVVESPMLVRDRIMFLLHGRCGSHKLSFLAVHVRRRDLRNWQMDVNTRIHACIHKRHRRYSQGKIACGMTGRNKERGSC